MPRDKVTSRIRRNTNMFSRRIVITVSPGGVIILAGVVAVALIRIPYYLMSTTAVISTIIAVVTVVEARHQLRTFRYEMREKIVARLDDFDIPDDLPDLREMTEEWGEDAKVRRLRISRSA